ncbi:hypothetical protein [Actinomadura sp. NTSP31]|uniref:hypothetical protein n=1 Tax=Actinomadura sp. NTSP31 TaxID=1735447 RepID=UPI0035BEBC68
MAAVNDVADTATLLHLLTYGPLDREVERAGSAVEIVIEPTGRSRRRRASEGRRRKVVLSAAGKDADAAIVVGVNEQTCDPGATASFQCLLHDQLR